MPDYRTLYDREYLYVFDLEGHDVTVTIDVVKGAIVKNQEGKEQKKPILYFKEGKEKRGLVLCKTNGATIAGMYGTNYEQWIGKRITLFPTTTLAFGKTTECIRIRPRVPASKTPSGSFSETPKAPPPEAPEHLELREPGDDSDELLQPTP